MTTLRLLLVDDMPQVREGLHTALTLAGGIDVIGEAADGLEAVELAASLEPDVVLMDLEMPVLDGLEAARRIKTRSAACRIVALTVHGDPALRRQARLAGFDEFVIKGTPFQDLVRALTGN